MPGAVSLSGSIETRTAIMVEIDKNILAINRAFKERPESVDLSTLKNLLKQLTETNAEIKQRQEELAKRACLTGKCGKWTDRSLIAAVVILSIVASILQVTLAILATDSKKLRWLAIGGAVCSSASGVSSAIQGLVSREVDSADDDEREERFFVRFMNAFEDYRNADDRGKASAEFKNCLKTLSEVPDQELKKLNLPPKPLWVESTAKILKSKDPENDVTRNINGRMEKIAQTCLNKPSDSQLFKGEQGRPVVLEPIAAGNEDIARQFDSLEEALGCKMPFISLNGKFYDRLGNMYTTVQEAEANTMPKDHVAVHINAA